MKTIIYLFLIIVLSSPVSYGQLRDSKRQYVIINADHNSGQFIDYKFVNVIDAVGREAYVLNARFKIDKLKRSAISDDSDFMFTFYIIPNKKLLLKEFADSSKIKNALTISISKIRLSLISAGTDDYFDFRPLIKANNKFYSLEHCIVVGQAFALQEDEQYFPEYGEKSSKFQLNLLSKPYSRESIDAYRKIIFKDSTALKPFSVWVEDFYDKWFISKIDRKNKTIDFWMDLKPIHDSGYSFGRITTEIKYKIGFGVTDFTIIPYYELLGEYLKGSNFPVPFTFKEVIDIKKFIK